jgi:DNA-3-methyladenine glycosylase I
VSGALPEGVAGVPPANGAVPGPDGRLRCPWALLAAEYVDYHDLEWGKPVTTVPGLYERMTLEAFQSGLSWLTILRKRDNFRRAFADFAPERVALFDDQDFDRLMHDAGIVRNRAKIEAAIGNARVVAEWGQGFADLILGYAEPDRPRPRTMADYRSTSPGSVALSRELRKRGIRFFGPTTAYAMMQAVGLVDDHLADCFVPSP